MRGILLTIALGLCHGGISQAVLRVDKTEISIGDQIKATIRADLGDGKIWINIVSVWPDSMEGMEVVNGPVWNRENQSATEATWVIAVFDTGWVRIPPLSVVIQHHDRLDTFFTNDILVMVIPVEPDSTGLKPLKEIYIQPFSPRYYVQYLPHLAAILLIFAGLFFWLRRRKAKQVTPELASQPPLPHEWAIAALEELAERRLWQKGEVKEHYTALTAILRGYLERRYAIHALEQTSDEILMQLRQQRLRTSLLTDTEELLSVADLIKFAKADPGIDIHSATINRVRLFVQETTPVFVPGGIDQGKPSGDEVME